MTFHPIQCVHCEYKAPWPNYMRKHILRFHKAVRDNLCHLCDFKAFIYEDLSHHLRQKHQVLINPHPNRDQIEDIEIVKDNRELTHLDARTSKASYWSPSEKRLSVPEPSVDPKTRAEILERILSLDTELSQLQQQKIKVVENNQSDGEDDPHIEALDAGLEDDQELLAEEDEDEQEPSAEEEDPVKAESELSGDELNDQPIEEEEENDPGVSSEEDESVKEKYKELINYEDGDLVAKEETDSDEVETDSSEGASPRKKRRKAEESGESKRLEEKAKNEIPSEEEKTDPSERAPQRKKRRPRKERREQSGESASTRWRNSGEKPVCPICQKVPGRDRLTSHLQIHNTERNYICHICRADFNSENYLKKHVKRVHQSLEEDLPCSHCGEMFSRTSALEQHVLMQHSPAECRLCDKVLESQLELKTHLKEEHDTKWTKPGADWICELCGKVTSKYFCFLFSQIFLFRFWAARTV